MTGPSFHSHAEHGPAPLPHSDDGDCPLCHGSGVVAFSLPINDGGYRGQTVTRNCPACNPALKEAQTDE